MRYYNNVGSMEELLHLRHNSHLEELDLRLNPVAKNAPDYRLILIHLLPNLRRLGKSELKKLVLLKNYLVNLDLILLKFSSLVFIQVVFLNFFVVF